MRNPVFDTSREEVGGEIHIQQKGPLPESILDDPRLGKVEVIKGNGATSKVEIEAFMNELVEIYLQEPAEAGMGEIWVVPLTVGRITQRVMRGMPQTIKRKYVEILARCRKAGVQANGYRDSTGEAVNDFRRHSRALEYPFQVLHDPSGKKGLDWLAGILRAER